MKRKLEEIFFRIINCTAFELKFYSIKTDWSTILSALIVALQSYVLSIGGVSKFFSTENLLIPKNWFLFKPTFNSLVIASIFILLTHFLLWLIKKSKDEKDKKFALKVIGKYCPDVINKTIQNLHNEVNLKYAPQGLVRISLFLPIRLGWFKWRLKMVFKTNNIKSQELNAEFRLHEGVLGYSLMNATKQKSRQCYCNSLDVSNPSNLPASYIPLMGANRNLIKYDIKGVLIVIFYVKNNIISLLAIDTNEPQDMNILENKELHETLINFLQRNQETIELAWREKNNA